MIPRLPSLTSGSVHSCLLYTSERTRIELAATGEQASERAVQTSVDLTARETQVCRLAADEMCIRDRPNTVRITLDIEAIQNES